MNLVGFEQPLQSGVGGYEDDKWNNLLSVSEKYVVIGARRDAWGPGFASSTVGTSVMVELARAVTEMIKSGETLCCQMSSIDNIYS